MASPRFTFCIPNLNKIDFLPACIESMLAQDCDDWCCVFVDGFSTDGCWEYMQRFVDDPRFRLMRGLRQGMYADWNYCLEQVETEYFYILTSDDTCSPKLLSSTVEALSQYPEIKACHFLYSLIDESGDIIYTSEQFTKLNFSIYQEPNQTAHIRSGLSEFMFHLAYRTLYKSITSLVMRRSLIDKLKGFSLNHGSAGDFDWAMRLCLETDVLFIPECLATWRIYDSQVTQGNSDLYHAREAFLIGMKNIENLVDSQQHFLQPSTIDKDFLLSQLRTDYFSVFTVDCISFRFFSILRDEMKFIPLKQYFYYLSIRAVRLLSFKKLFKYRSREEFVRDLVDLYNLQWHPLHVKLLNS
jgi:glycosyltransferase involved in cell wall biosynthesis